MRLQKSPPILEVPAFRGASPQILVFRRVPESGPKVLGLGFGFALTVHSSADLGFGA